MPHLAPLSWALTPLIFWAILLSLSASMWWTSTPDFPICSTPSHARLFSSWNWS